MKVFRQYRTPDGPVEVEVLGVKSQCGVPIVFIRLPDGQERWVELREIQPTENLQ